MKKRFMPGALELWILGICLTLGGLGLLVVFSSSSVMGYFSRSESDYYLKKQFLNLLVGLVVFLVAWRINPDFWRRAATTIGVITIILCGVVLFTGVGNYASPVRRWLWVGFIYIQPSELAKTALVMWMAARMLRWRERGSRPVELLPDAAIVLVAFFLILEEPDLGMAFILLATAIVLMLVAGVPIRYFLLALLVLVPLAVMLVLGKNYRMDRMLAFLSPEAHADGKAYQITQSLIAMGSGGILGLGPGASRQKLFFLPQSHTDFAFAILGEEYGLWGTIFIITLFVGLLLIGFRIAKRNPDFYQSMLAIGITFGIVFQAFINIGVVTANLPTTGVPLPFISYGGSSLVTTMGALGILAACARRVGEPMPAVNASALGTTLSPSRPVIGYRGSFYGGSHK
jgi:cell division protein FtsW